VKGSWRPQPAYAGNANREHPCEGVVARGSRATTMRESIRLASLGLVGRGQPFLPEKSHVISLGQFLMCLENVGIATTRFQSLKDVLGNYVRHLWGTMRVTVGVPRIRRVLQGFVGRSQGSRPYFRGLAVDSRMVRTGLRFWCCSGCGEDLVDEVDALWCGATRVHPRQ